MQAINGLECPLDEERLSQLMNEKKPKHRLAILTSGGDAPGMNAALRAAVRTALEEDTEAIAIREGYRGLVEGGDAFKAMDWDAVGGIMHMGGTVIGTARCDDFRDREGRLRAAQNLVEHGIDRLIVMGGDGSLTAADILHREWSGLIKELEEQDRIPEGAAERFAHLSLAGIGASIGRTVLSTPVRRLPAMRSSSRSPVTSWSGVRSAP